MNKIDQNYKPHNIIYKSDNWDTLKFQNVSIIIPFYNRINLLVESLESVINQTYNNYEIIIVDDCSTDSYLNEIYLLLEKSLNPFIILKTYKNLGPSNARRVGLKFIRGNYIQYLDSDDILSSDKIYLQVEQLKKDKQLLMSYGHTVTFTNNLKGNYKTLGRSNQKFNSILPHIADRIVWTTSSCLWRSSIANRPEYWKNLRAGEDFVYDFLLGMLDYKINKIDSDKPIVFKRIHDKMLSSNIYSDMQYQNQIILGYDILLDKVSSIENNIDLLKILFKLYYNKAWFYIINKEHNKVNYCIKKMFFIDRRKIPIIFKICFHVNNFLPNNLGFDFLRKAQWSKKKIVKYL